MQMKIGVTNEINLSLLDFYKQNYDVLRTPDFKDSTRLLKPEHGIKYLGNPNQKNCRFCGKSELETSFKKIAHAFPESIGNKALATYYECDACNDFFGRTIEDDYGKFFGLYHSIMMITGKDGKKKCNFKIPCGKRTDKCREYCVRISLNEDLPCINVCREVGKDIIELKTDSLTISAPVGKCCPIAVFKAVVKMAITVMPVEEVNGFSRAIEWILKPEHKNFYKKKPLLIKYQMIPGFNVTKYPHFVLYRRKRDVWNVPYMLFNLTYGCFSLLVEVPWNGEDLDAVDSGMFERIPFPPIPFHISQNGIWDMSGTEVPKGIKHSINLYVGEMQQFDADRVELKDGKPVIK